MADAHVENPGPLTRHVLDFVEAMQGLEPDVKDPDDWAPLAEFVDTDAFERVGTFGEVQGWQQYTEMLTRWASATDGFETRVRRVSELPGLVYLEVEERHHRGEQVHVVNSITVFAFEAAAKIRHLDVYLQQPR